MSHERAITGYTLKVLRGPRAGLVKTYLPAEKKIARQFADKLDNEYGAVCTNISPIIVDVMH